MATRGINEVENGIEKKLDGVIKRANNISSYMNRTLFRQIQKAQIERWQTRGKSEGFDWPELSPIYASYKKKKYASAPGHGNVMLVATGKLQEGATGQNPAYFFSTVSNTQFIFGINLQTLPYAIYPGQERPYMKFSDEHVSDMKRGIRDFICKNKGAV